MLFTGRVAILVTVEERAPNTILGRYISTETYMRNLRIQVTLPYAVIPRTFGASSHIVRDFLSAGNRSCLKLSFFVEDTKVTYFQDTKQQLNRGQGNNERFVAK